MVTQACSMPGHPLRTCASHNRSSSPKKPTPAATNAPTFYPKALIDTAKQQITAIAPKLASIGVAALLTLTPVSAAHANEKIAEFATSGFLPVAGVFRDTVQVVALKDKDVQGVTLYYTDYSRSLQDKLSKDPFADPSQSSITCLATGKVTVPDPEAIKGPDGKEIFSELKTLNIFHNKQLRVRRVYDEKNGSVIYVSYSTRNSGDSVGRYRTSICALPVDK